jgi:hypothetical protein
MIRIAPVQALQLPPCSHILSKSDRKRGDFDSEQWFNPTRSNKEPRRMDSAHIAALQAKHSGIDRRIADEIARPLPDRSTLATLKKQKLKIKEAMSDFHH